MFYIGNKISVNLPMSCWTREFNLINVLHILKFYFYLYTFRVPRRGVRVFVFPWSIPKWPQRMKYSLKEKQRLQSTDKANKWEGQTEKVLSPYYGTEIIQDDKIRKVAQGCLSYLVEFHYKANSWYELYACICVNICACVYFFAHLFCQETLNSVPREML